MVLFPAGSVQIVGPFEIEKKDTRIPSIILPTLRRVFPTLVAQDLCKVQPMNGPVASAFGTRFNYVQRHEKFTLGPFEICKI